MPPFLLALQNVSGIRALTGINSCVLTRKWHCRTILGNVLESNVRWTRKRWVDCTCLPCAQEVQLPDHSWVEAYTTEFSRTPIFILNPLSGHTNGAQWRQGESKFLPCFFVAWTRRPLTERFPWATEGPNSLKETLTLEKIFLTNNFGITSGLPVGLKFNLLSVTELNFGDGRYFVQKPYASEQLRWPIWPTFPSILLCRFTEDASLLLLYHGAKKVKNDQKPKSRGWVLS